MITIEKLYTDILNSKDLQLKLQEAVKTSDLAAFLKDMSCESDVNGFVAYARKMAAEANGEISDNDLEKVAGGVNSGEVLLSILTAGIGCAIEAIESACGSGVGDGPDGKLLCNDEDTGDGRPLIV